MRCCMSGVGSSRWPEKAVLVSSSDEDDSDDVFLMDASTIPKESFH